MLQWVISDSSSAGRPVSGSFKIGGQSETSSFIRDIRQCRPTGSSPRVLHCKKWSSCRDVRCWSACSSVSLVSWTSTKYRHCREVRLLHNCSSRTEYVSISRLSSWEHSLYPCIVLCSKYGSMLDDSDTFKCLRSPRNCKPSILLTDSQSQMLHFSSAVQDCSCRDFKYLPHANISYPCRRVWFPGKQICSVSEG